MRDIKFRAWDTENKQILEVQELNFENYIYGGGMEIKTTMYGDYFDYREMPLMQYTGLNDKNGKEIYEGDIISNGTEKCLVVWIKEQAGFMLKLLDKEFENEEWTNPMIDLKKDDEVIGNIYDSPELLVKGAEDE